MDGHEYIRIYDNVLGSEIADALVSIVSNPDNHPYHASAVKECVDNSLYSVVMRYGSEYNHLSLMNTIDLANDGVVVKQAVTSDDYQCASDRVGNTNRIATIIMFLDDDSELFFPKHGIKIQASKGRAVAFPAHWTHPYQFTNEGMVVSTNLTYQSVEADE